MRKIRRVQHFNELGTTAVVSMTGLAFGDRFELTVESLFGGKFFLHVRVAG